MQWIHDYQLFLFDFDGLLVNTEEVHFQAYQRMCAGRGFKLDWDFDTYCQHAHYDSDKLQKGIYKRFPKLKEIEPNWDVLYQEKRQAMMDLLNEGNVHLMPGVEHLLKALDKAQIKRCVVTHSPDLLISVVRLQNPVLNTIPFWITRELYHHPKPHPECYLKAIQLHAAPHDKIIGFEDTPRGLTALMQTKATPVIICQAKYPEIAEFEEKGAQHATSFMDFHPS